MSCPIEVSNCLCIPRLSDKRMSEPFSSTIWPGDIGLPNYAGSHAHCHM